MSTFRVLWQLEVEADTPLAAAQTAREIQLDPDSLASCFEVNGLRVDLAGQAGRDLMACPQCHSTDFVASLGMHGDGSEMYETVTCDDCEHSWYRVYVLTDTVNT